MAHALQSIGEYLAIGVFMTLKQLLIVLGPLLLLASVLQLLSRYVRNHAAAIIGQDLYTWLTAPGVMIHELGHVFFCILFGHKIVKVRLFRPDRNGTVGVVEHGYNPQSVPGHRELLHRHRADLVRVGHRLPAHAASARQGDDRAARRRRVRGARQPHDLGRRMSFSARWP